MGTDLMKAMSFRFEAKLCLKQETHSNNLIRSHVYISIANPYLNHVSAQWVLKEDKEAITKSFGGS